MNTESKPFTNILPPIDDPISIRRRNLRMFKDKMATYGMTTGGISVIIAVMLIFFYLLYVVYPLLMPASMSAEEKFAIPAQAAGKTLHLEMEEKGELAARFTDSGKAVFFHLKDGSLLEELSLPLPADTTISTFTPGDMAHGVVALGLSNGQVLVVKREYKISYPNDVRTVTPKLSYPLGEEAIVLDTQGQALQFVALQETEELSTIAAITADQRLVVVGFTREESFLSDEVQLVREESSAMLGKENIVALNMDKDQRNVYVITKAGELLQYNIENKTEPKLIQTIPVVAKGIEVTSTAMLTGGISLLIGSSDGVISQWFPVRDENNVNKLTHIRDFNSQAAAITQIVVEQRRKGFLALDAEGNVGVYHSTAERNLLVESVTSGDAAQIAIAPRADRLLVQGDGQVQSWEIYNEHPEISMHSLWGKVWYESYPEPQYIWQSSSASEDFEPKFSLTPLAFGTLKAAFYAMLMAIPLAVLGAIYTAYFMSPGARTLVKPGIEIMEALPTVILGFLAGLWLAPAVETNLPGVFALLIFMPIGIVLFTYIWHVVVPKKYALMVPDGWAAALLIPVILFIAWFALAISPVLEGLLFGGDMRIWLNEAGITFDQRNSIIVGLTMGFAVIPTIFSITEDAVFSVPKHLTTGSLALGATSWQTMTRVVILTASPGIFSAVMIGMGRAVGETMIVLMATGNTPIMDMNIFEGMRTLSANIAVEMPESELNSTHYRILFLSGLVLFVFTFFFNTIAEVVRQRLRSRYGSL